jgi:hypothetical protein
MASRPPRRLFFVVEGDGRFPFDMLRYDQCWPASEADSLRLADEWTAPRRIVLITDSVTAPTVDPWRSHGWSVVHTERML